MLILDASAALSWLIPDEIDEVSLHMLRAIADETVCVPPLWRYEVLNGLRAAEVRGRISAEQIADRLHRISALGLIVDERDARSDLTAELALSRRHKISVYDAAYLELATRKVTSLMTRDRGLAAAAGALGLLWQPTS